MNESKKKYYLANKEKILRYSLKYQKEHHIEHNRAVAKWKLANPDKVRTENKQWDLANPVKRKEIRKKYDQTIKGKINKQKSDAHYRGLGFTPLNTYQPGLEPHHIDKEKVIYVPKRLHETMWHRPKKGIAVFGNIVADAGDLTNQ
jgi:hypothetical protein